MSDEQDQRDPDTYAIIGAAMEVHKELGHGFLEAVYHDSLEIEFQLRNIPYQREVELPLTYKDRPLKCKYKADFVLYGNIVVELKALRELGGVERSQVINYLKATGFHRALLLNFGSPWLKYERFVN